MTRGDVLMVVVPGDCGKVRPAVVIQAQLLSEIPSVVVVPCTSDLVDDCIYRPNIPDNQQTGLNRPTQAMVDKIAAVSKHRVRAVIGRVSRQTLNELTQATQFVVGVFDR